MTYSAPPSRPWFRSYDAKVPHALDEPAETMVARFWKTVAEAGDRPALTFMNRTLSWTTFGDHVARLAAALTELGVTSGSRVAILSPNLPQFEIAYFAIQTLGAVPVPTNPLYTAREIEHQWNDAGCGVALVMDYVWNQKVRAIRDRLPVREYVILSIPEYLRFPLRQLAPLKLRRADPPLIARVAAERRAHRFPTRLKYCRPLWSST